MRHFLENWREITHDKNVLDIVKHCHIEFCNEEIPVRTQCKKNVFNRQEDAIVDSEIQKLLKMQVIKEVQHVSNEYISPIFLVAKKNGEYRMILNLKELNQSIVYHHFKMETFESALKMIKKDCYMASIDLRHAYYSVYMAEADQVKLRFEKSGRLYQYSCLPNGIACAPRLFTKLLKPVYASLRMLGHSNSGYIDDSLLVADTEPECEENVKDTTGLMSDLGFIIHKEKSVMKPTKQITFLGKNINSENMTVSLPDDKVQTIVQECKDMYRRTEITVRTLARILGLMVSSFSAVEYGPLFYRNLEKAKIEALRYLNGDFNGKMAVTQPMRKELKWWIDNLHCQNRVIDHGNADLVITTDASSLGWAGICEGESIGGRWLLQESLHHINYLELLAVSHSVKSFCRSKSNVHVQVKSDNSCTVSYLSKMGGCKSELCNDLAFDIWSWCMQRSIWLSASHVPGVDNISDHGSRHFSDNTEWKLNSQIFITLTDRWGMPEIDIFASRVNKQIDRYVSWKKEPEAERIDAFSFDWSNVFMYCYPPFSLVARTLSKLRRDRGECILVAPLWPTQSWWTTLMEHLVDLPVMIPVTKQTLVIPNRDNVHPLANQLMLVACRLSGNPLKTEEFQRNQPISLWRPGKNQQKSNMRSILENGFCSVVKNRSVQFIQI